MSPFFFLICSFNLEVNVHQIKIVLYANWYLLQSIYDITNFFLQ